MATKKLVAINIEQTTGDFDAESYYRIPDEFLAHLKKLEEEHEIVGFVYDGTYNFGALLKKTGKKPAKGKAVRVRVGGNPLKD